MADRIVVMKDGAIEQIGTPVEVYLKPATPFVADFVGKTNLLPAKRAGERRIQVGEQRFECDVDEAAGAHALRIFFRPEDVRVRGVNGSTPNSAAAVVEKVEFLGAYSRLTFRLNGIGTRPSSTEGVSIDFPDRPRPIRSCLSAESKPSGATCTVNCAGCPISN